MSKTYKIIICIIAAFILIATLPNFCKADDSIGDIISRGDDFVNTGKDQSSPVGQDTIKSNSSFIYLKIKKGSKQKIKPLFIRCLVKTI